MRWRSDTLRRLLFASIVVVAACDPTERDVAPSLPSVYDAPSPDPGRASDTAAMVYEDDEDYAILHDTSNLRPPDMDETDYRRSLQESSREELKQLLPDASFPTRADLDLLSLRWFSQGTGVIAQNRSGRAFSIAAHFSSATESSCEFTVPWKLVGPSASAMFMSDRECGADRATVSINDEYGYFADTAVVQSHEERP